MDTALCAPERIDRAELMRALSASGTVPREAGLAGLVASPIGIGHTADTLQVFLDWDDPEQGPRTLVAKIPSADPQSAQTAASLGAYEREARFYVDLAPRTSLSVPKLYGVMDVEGAPAGILLEDLSQLDALDQLTTVPVPVVRALRQELVRLQAPFWEDPETAALPWLHRRLGVPIPGILERMQRSWSLAQGYLASGFDADEAKVVDRFVEAAGGWAESLGGPYSLTHHDFRVDNMLFDADRVVVLDWQTVGWGTPMFDVAYLLGTSLDPATRRRVEREEIARHVEELSALGVEWSLDEAWLAYRQASLAVLLMLVPPTGSVKRTARGDAMFRHLIRQGARMALDLGATEFLEERAG